MSGLQSSITTQIARDYYFAPQGHDETPSHLIFAAGESHNGRWGPNIPMFIKAVGAHPSRIANLYFTFLFLTRAVAKAQDIFMEMNYSVGDTQEAAISRQLIQKLVTLPNLRNISILPDGSATHLDESLRAAVECSIGFDESSLFQVRQSSFRVVSFRSFSLFRVQKALKPHIGAMFIFKTSESIYERNFDKGRLPSIFSFHWPQISKYQSHYGLR